MGMYDKDLSGVEMSAKDDYKVYSNETSGSGHYYISLKVIIKGIGWFPKSRNIDGLP